MNKTMHRIGSWLWLCTLVMGLVCLPGPVHAQRIIIDPPMPPEPMPPQWPPAQIGPITIDEFVVEARISGAAANVRVTQVFRNTSGAVVEGQFVFPLPPDAAVADFQMKVDGSVMEGVLMPAEEARGIYERIVREQRDPALLQFVGQGLFQTNVFPIPPGETRTIQLTYNQLVSQEQDLYRFRFPLGSSFARLAEEGGLRIRVELEDQPGLRTVYSPNWGAAVKRGGEDRAEVVFTGAGAAPDSFFDVFWGNSSSAVGANLLTYRPAGEDGYFTLLVAPRTEQTAQTVAARDVILVLDVSGSMEGAKMEQARAAADYLVDHLNEQDRFSLVSFSTGVRLWQNGLQSVSAENAADAHEWIARLDAGGSTDINRALLEALALVGQRPDAELARPVYILFMTDGLPTQGETDPWRIWENATTNSQEGATIRLFTFGVGFDVNTILLDTLSKELGGRSSYVLPEEKIDEAVSTFYQSISTPVLTNVTLEFEGDVLVDEIYPFPLGDLFAGEQMVVTGRYRDGGEVAVVLTGSINGEQQQFRYEALSLAEQGGEPFVARLWASRKIGVLMEQVRRNGPDPEVIDAIVQLSLEYGIVTPYTSYLVQEPGMEGAVPVPSAPSGPQDGVGGGAPVAMAPAAEAYAADEAQRQANMAPSGASAVAASKAQNTLQTGDAVANNAQAWFVAGKTFVQQGWVTGVDGAALPFWVDTAYTGEMELQWVLFGSDEYFSLTEIPHMAEWLGVGQELVIVIDAAHALRVSTLAEEVGRQGGGEQPASPLAPAGASDPEASAPAEQDSWSEFWSWLWETITP
jgi:Ca-activated chloride channel family protein